MTMLLELMVKPAKRAQPRSAGMERTMLLELMVKPAKRTVALQPRSSTMERAMLPELMAKPANRQIRRLRSARVSLATGVR